MMNEERRMLVKVVICFVMLISFIVVAFSWLFMLQKICNDSLDTLSLESQRVSSEIETLKHTIGRLHDLDSNDK